MSSRSRSSGLYSEIRERRYPACMLPRLVFSFVKSLLPGAQPVRLSPQPFEPLDQRFLATIWYPKAAVRRIRKSGITTTTDITFDRHQERSNAADSQADCRRHTNGSVSHFHVLARRRKKQRRTGQNHSRRLERVAHLYC